MTGLRKHWVWLLVTLINAPAFAMLVAATISRTYYVLYGPVREPLNMVLSVTMGVGVWVEYFLLPLSLFVGFTLNPHVDESYRGWTWFAAIIAGASFFCALKIAKV